MKRLKSGVALDKGSEWNVTLGRKRMPSFTSNSCNVLWYSMMDLNLTLAVARRVAMDLILLQVARIMARDDGRRWKTMKSQC